jgi:hypothetical protein
MLAFLLPQLPAITGAAASANMTVKRSDFLMGSSLVFCDLGGSGGITA